MPNKISEIKISKFISGFRRYLPYLVIIFGVVIFHLIEVNVLDSIMPSIPN